MLDASFWVHVNKNGPPSKYGNCWLWTGTTNGQGYGRFQGKYVHRLMYVDFYGDMAGQDEVDHRCHNADPTCNLGEDCPHRLCCNPFHLEAVTHAVNLRRSPNTFQGKRSRQNKCKRGHPFDAANTFVRPDGTRKCRRCDVIRWHRRQAEKAVA